MENIQKFMKSAVNKAASQENMNNKNLLLKNKCQIYDYSLVVMEIDAAGGGCRIRCLTVNIYDFRFS